jgi:hypothetical protein
MHLENSAMLQTLAAYWKEFAQWFLSWFIPFVNNFALWVHGWTMPEAIFYSTLLVIATLVTLFILRSLNHDLGILWVGIGGCANLGWQFAKKIAERSRQPVRWMWVAYGFGLFFFVDLYSAVILGRFVDYLKAVIATVVMVAIGEAFRRAAKKNDQDLVSWQVKRFFHARSVFVRVCWGIGAVYFLFSFVEIGAKRVASGIVYLFFSIGIVLLGEFVRKLWNSKMRSLGQLRADRNQ